MSDSEWPQMLPLRPATNPYDDGIKQRYDNTTASGNSRQLNGNIYNNNAGHSASGDARQYMGDVTNNTNFNYTIRKRRSDETLREDGRNRAFLLASAEGQTPRVRHLLRLGVDLDYSDENGFNALHHACLSGFEDAWHMVRIACRNLLEDVSMAGSLMVRIFYHLAVASSHDGAIIQPTPDASEAFLKTAETVYHPLIFCLRCYASGKSPL